MEEPEVLITDIPLSGPWTQPGCGRQNPKVPPKVPTLLPSWERPLADASAGQQAGGPETLGASGSPGCSQPVPTWSIAIGGAGGGGAVLPVG